MRMKNKSLTLKMSVRHSNLVSINNKENSTIECVIFLSMNHVVVGYKRMVPHKQGVFFQNIAVLCNTMLLMIFKLPLIVPMESGMIHPFYLRHALMKSMYNQVPQKKQKKRNQS